MELRDAFIKVTIYIIIMHSHLSRRLGREHREICSENEILPVYIKIYMTCIFLDAQDYFLQIV